MRKIVSRHEQEKKNRRTGVIVGVILIFIMLLSLLGYSFGSSNNGEVKVNYNEFEFIKQGDFWTLPYSNTLLFFRHNPHQIMNINFSVKDLNNYVGKPLYISSEDLIAEEEIARDLFYQTQIVQRVQKACLNEKDCDGILPKKTCDDNFIIIQEDEKTEIVQDNNCVFIRGQKENLIVLSDEFLFKAFGITQ